MRQVALPVLERADSPFVRFLVVGILNTAFGYALFAILVWSGLWYPAAAAVSTIGGIVFNFNTTGRLVFRNRDRTLFWKFLAVYGVTYAASVGLMRLGLVLGVPVLWTGAAIALPMAVVAFLLQRSLVFRSAA